MRADQLRLHQVIVELRYPATYRCFDHAGEVADQILDAMPDWELTEASPTGLGFARLGRGIRATVGPQFARVAQVQSEDFFDLEEGDSFYTDYLGVLRPALALYRVSFLTRIGYRTMHTYPTSTPEAALDEWRALPFVKFNAPGDAPTDYKAGDVVLNLEVSSDLHLRFAVSNLEMEVSVGPTRIAWPEKMIYKLPPEKRKPALEALVAAEKKFAYLPQFGLQVDLDWSRRDFPALRPDDEVARFVDDCRCRRGKILGSFLGARR
jgi:hypothetical protein